MLRVFLLLTVAACWLSAAAAAQPLSIHAFVDQTTVGEEERVLYTIELRGDFRAIDRIGVPPSSGLAVIQMSPHQSWSRMTRGGRTVQEVTLQWQLEPLRVGAAEIGRTELTIDGQRFVTDPVQVQVVPQVQRPPPTTPSTRPTEPPAGASDLFLRPEFARTTAYVGEQVVVDYVLYYAPGVHPRNARIASSWDAPGFWREDLDLGSRPTARSVQIDGRPYEAVTIKRAAFFPTRSGELAIDSLVVELDALRAERPGGLHGPLYNPFGSRFQRQRLAAPSVPLTILPLPDGAPPAFRGATGNFSMRIEVDRTETEAGEPVRFTVILRGDGNLATLEGPAWDVPREFEVYPPQEAAHLVRTDPRLRGERRFTYTVVPLAGGAQELPPVHWAFFDPQAEAYRTLVSEPLPLHVTGPAELLAEAIATGARRGLHTEAGRWQRVRPFTPRFQRPATLVAFGVPLLALLALVFVRRTLDRRADDSPYARSLRAFPEARTALREAERLRQSGDTRGHLAVVEAAVHRFLAERLGIPARSLTLTKLDAALADRGVVDPTRSELVNLLAEAEAGQFAPRSAGAPEPAPDRAARLLAVVNAEAPSLDPEAP